MLCRRTSLLRSIDCLYNNRTPRSVHPPKIPTVRIFRIMHRMVHPFTFFHINTMSRETLYVYPLQRLTFMLKFFCLTRLGSLITCKYNLFKANLRANLAILMTRKDNTYKATLRASRGHYTVRKDSITTF